MQVFFFNDTATTEIYTLSLHDALPISVLTRRIEELSVHLDKNRKDKHGRRGLLGLVRSEERFSRNAETDLVCRLLLEKNKTSPTAADVIGDPRGSTLHGCHDGNTGPRT